MLAHNVFFTLKDNSPENCEALVADCHEFLSGHPGTAFFSAGVLCKELARPVNDHGFDVALNVIFETKQDQDVYQVSDRHIAFIEKNKESWEQVRVFDNYAR
ncbi:MAG: stress responsive protein [Planctomycetaceae bacterium]|nr:stress responsive protein [Planctomycetaceae bacterium]